MDFRYEYKLNREYTWSIRNKTTKGYEQDNYFIHFKVLSYFIKAKKIVDNAQDGNSYYNEMDTRVKLMRRRRAGHSKASIFVFISCKDLVFIDGKRCFWHEKIIGYFIFKHCGAKPKTNSDSRIIPS